MKNIVFIAPPGAGKGTQSDLLVEKYGYIHISTGDLIREEISLQTELGKSIEKTISDGNLLSDDIVTDLLRKKLIEIKDTNGFILDGYPRRYEQAIILDNLLKEIDCQIDVVLYLDMDDDVAMKRALGRLTCPKCKRGYNKFEEVKMPKVEGMCDDCHVELIGRDDDNEEAFKTRLSQYKDGVMPILDYYKEKDILNVIDNSGTPEETFKRIESVI